MTSEPTFYLIFIKKLFANISFDLLISERLQLDCLHFANLTLFTKLLVAFTIKI